MAVAPAPFLGRWPEDKVVEKLKQAVPLAAVAVSLYRAPREYGHRHRAD